MGRVVIVYGKSGGGKSRSLKNFGEDEIYLINIESKDLPFKKAFKYVSETDDYSTILKGLAKMPTNTAVIDDAGYLLTNKFMRSHSAGLRGNQVYELYNDIGDQFWGLFEFIKRELPKEKIVYILMHEDLDINGSTKLKTIGKLLDDKVCIEGMVTICLRCMSKDGQHFFRTKTDGNDITKAPEDMFLNAEIENDLKAVDTTIRNYYNIGKDQKHETI